MLHHIPRPFGLGIFLWWTVQDENRAAHSAHQLSWAVLPKTPAGTGHPLPGGLYWEQQKNRGTGECGMVQENGMMLEVLPLEAGGARLVRV